LIPRVGLVLLRVTPKPKPGKREDLIQQEEHII
jgi:hypothetical protein